MGLFLYNGECISRQIKQHSRRLSELLQGSIYIIMKGGDVSDKGKYLVNNCDL